MVFFFAAMPGVAAAESIYASIVIEAVAYELEGYPPFEVVKFRKEGNSHVADGGVNALGPPDYLTDGDASGWRWWEGHMILGFAQPLIDGDGDDLRFYSFGPGTGRISVSSDLKGWTSLGLLPVSDKGEIITTSYDLVTFGVDSFQYLRIDKSKRGSHSCKFIDAVEGFHVAPLNDPPDQPVLFLPTDGVTVTSLTPELQTEAFSDPDDDDAHFETQWQISTAPEFLLIVSDAKSTSHLTSFIVPESLLNHNATYYWRVRFYDNRVGESEWSDHYSFKTPIASDDDTNGNGIPDDQEVDGNVDLDNDGTPDRDQNDMKCVKTVDGDGQIGIKISTNVKSIDSIMSKSSDTIPDTDTKPDEMPLGLISFRLSVEEGAAADVTVYLSEPAPTGAKWCKYDPVKEEWLFFSEEHAIFSADGTVVTLKLEDGGYGDADGAVNGVIFDPSGPGLLNVIPDTYTIYGTDKDTRDEGGCFIAAASR